MGQGWATNRLECEAELSSFDFWDNLGYRLQLTAQDNGRQAHPFADTNDSDDDDLSQSYEKYRTLIHGDPKQANYLFRRQASTFNNNNNNEEEEELPQVGMIDFQWCGFGLAATDVAHFMTSAVHADRLIDGGQDILLDYYFDQLQLYLVEYGAFENDKDALQHFSFDTFTTQYETGVLDICRLVIAYAWSRLDPVDESDHEGITRTMNKNSYNKSKPNVVWLLSRCDEI